RCNHLLTESGGEQRVTTAFPVCHVRDAKTVSPDRFPVKTSLRTGCVGRGSAYTDQVLSVPGPTPPCMAESGIEHKFRFRLRRSQGYAPPAAARSRAASGGARKGSCRPSPAGRVEGEAEGWTDQPRRAARPGRR